jgi:hypothetical protein
MVEILCRTDAQNQRQEGERAMSNSDDLEATLTPDERDLLEKVRDRLREDRHVILYADGDDEDTERGRNLKPVDFVIINAVTEAKSGKPARLHRLLNDLLSKHSSFGNIFGPGGFTAKPPPRERDRRVKSDNPFLEQAQLEPEERLAVIRRITKIIQEERGMRRLPAELSHTIAAIILDCQPIDIRKQVQRGSKNKIKKPSSPRS